MRAALSKHWPKEYRPTRWTQTPEGHWQSGNAQIRLVGNLRLNGRKHGPSWVLYLRTSTGWKPYHAAGRSGLYGSPGQAKNGIARAGNLVPGLPERFEFGAKK